MKVLSKYRPATERQKAYLESRGIHFDRHTTVAEASELISEDRRYNDPSDDRHPHDIEDFQ